MNSQIGASVRRREEPSPSSPGRCSCLDRPRSRQLDVRGRQISGNPTSIAWGDIWAAAGSADQCWGRFFSLLIVVNNSDKPTPLGHSGVRGGPLAHYGTCSCWIRIEFLSSWRGIPSTQPSIPRRRANGSPLVRLRNRGSNQRRTPRATILPGRSGILSHLPLGLRQWSPTHRTSSGSAHFILAGLPA